MAQYANANFATYSKEVDLTNALRIENHVPDNINQVKTLDDFVKDIMREKGKQKDLNFKNMIENSGQKQVTNGSVIKDLENGLSNRFS